MTKRDFEDEAEKIVREAASLFPDAPNYINKKDSLIKAARRTIRDAQQAAGEDDLSMMTGMTFPDQHTMPHGKHRKDKDG